MLELYPDVLMASTYSLQLVTAARWLEKDDNKKLRGDAMAKALALEDAAPTELAGQSTNRRTAAQLHPQRPHADGSALVAWPASYSISGIMFYIVSQDGLVFQKDLGPRTGVVV